MGYNRVGRVVSLSDARAILKEPRAPGVTCDVDRNEEPIEDSRSFGPGSESGWLSAPIVGIESVDRTRKLNCETKSL